MVIEQGTVIYGIRSEKYPSVPCYGVVITARCDIAQNKVPKYYFLVAVDASDWFRTQYGYNLVYKQKINNLKQQIKDIANEFDLNGEVLISLSSDELDTIFSDVHIQIENEKKKLKKLDSLKEKIALYHFYLSKGDSDEFRGNVIKSDSQPAVEFLKDIDQGKQMHLYFLPQHAYLKNKTMSKGIIIDLLEIRELSIDDARRIMTPGIDFQLLNKRTSPQDVIEIITGGNAHDVERMLSENIETIRLSKDYWLKNDSDYVAIEGNTMSPWCEHLMQRFSNAFIRIGLDNPTQKDYEDIIAACSN